MSDGFDVVIASLNEELNKAMKAVIEIKKMINNAHTLKGEAPPYTDVDFNPITGTINIMHDQFFGKGLSTAVKEFLAMKGRAAKAEEIFEALNKGGFEWPNAWKENLRLKNLAISLGKNRYDFLLVRTSEGNAYGLWDFYPEKKREKEKQQAQKNDNGAKSLTEDTNIQGEAIETEEAGETEENTA